MDIKRIVVEVTVGEWWRIWEYYAIRLRVGIGGSVNRDSGSQSGSKAKS